MMRNIFEYLESLHPLSEELKAYLLQHTKKQAYKKNELILRAGDIDKNVWLLENGTARFFHYEDDREVTTRFVTAVSVLVIISSFTEQSPSRDNIIAVEDCRLQSLSALQLQYLYNHFPEAKILSKKILLNFYKEMDRHLHLVQLPSIEQRYTIVTKECPWLLEKIPLPHLASYIGVSVRSLMRIRYTQSKIRR